MFFIDTMNTQTIFILIIIAFTALFFLLSQSTRISYLLSYRINIFLIVSFFIILTKYTDIIFIDVILRTIYTLLLTHFVKMWWLIFYFIRITTLIFTKRSISFIYLKSIAISALIRLSNFLKWIGINIFFISFFMLLLLFLILSF